MRFRLLDDLRHDLRGVLTLTIFRNQILDVDFEDGEVLAPAGDEGVQLRGRLGHVGPRDDEPPGVAGIGEVEIRGADGRFGADAEARGDEGRTGAVEEAFPGGFGLSVVSIYLHVTRTGHIDQLAMDHIDR